jgi:hypothetical protein
VPAIPSWLPEPLWDQFAALLPDDITVHLDAGYDSQKTVTSSPDWYGRMTSEPVRPEGGAS